MAYSLRLGLMIVLLISNTIKPCAQTKFLLEPGSSRVEIPFEFINNFIIVEMYINVIYPYKLIFDTGAEHTILTRKDFMDFPSMSFERTFYLVGSDQDRVIPAHLVRGVRMDLPGKAASPKEDVLMLDEDVFGFEEYTGVQIDGILSAATFDGYIIRINYQRNIITLFERGAYDTPSLKRADAIPLEIHRQKPYFYTNIQIRPDLPPTKVKLLADTGAGTSIILFTDSTIVPPVHAVPGKFAMGIGGDLDGYIGRTHELQVGRFVQKQPVTYYQEVDSLDFKDYLNHRNGLVGNQVWSHFIIDFDYTKQTLWLQPSIIYDKPYVYDRSGLSIVAGGKSLNQFYVHVVQPNSPGAEADIRPGDQIMAVNRVPAGFVAMPRLLRVLRSKRSKPVLLEIKRDNQRFKVQIKLRDLI